MFSSDQCRVLRQVRARAPECNAHFTAERALAANYARNTDVGTGPPGAPTGANISGAAGPAGGPGSSAGRGPSGAAGSGGQPANSGGSPAGGSGGSAGG